MSNSGPFLACLLWALFITIADSAAAPDKLELSISIDRSALPDGRVTMQSELHNSTDQPVVFLPWNTPFDSSLNGGFLRVTMRQGESYIELPYLGRMVKRPAPTADDFVTLAPDAVLLGELELTKDYKFCRGRHYIIKFNSGLTGWHGLAIETQAASTDFSAGEAFPDCH